MTSVVVRPSAEGKVPPAKGKKSTLRGGVSIFYLAWYRRQGGTKRATRIN